MYICSCHAVTDGQIKAFAEKNGCNWKKMTRELKAGTQCGICAKSAKAILEQSCTGEQCPRFGKGCRNSRKAE